MIPLNPWEHQNVIKTLYGKCVEEICDSYQITRIELDILLFLANNPGYDTARDVAEYRGLAKSQVSQAVDLLSARGVLRRTPDAADRRVVHLAITEAAVGAGVTSILFFLTLKKIRAIRKEEQNEQEEG